MKTDYSVFEVEVFGQAGFWLDASVSRRIIRVLIVFLLLSCTFGTSLGYHLFLFFFEGAV
jgi:hypothetical protein